MNEHFYAVCQLAVAGRLRLARACLASAETMTVLRARLAVRRP